MNVRWTWLLITGALGLGLFAFLTEPKGGVRVTGSSGAAPYVPMKASDVTAVEFIRSNSVVRVERSADAWRMREPVTYPAQATAIEALLSALEKLQPRRWMPLREVGGPEALKGFGLDASAATLTLESAQGPWLLRIGSPTPLGDQFYFQRVGLDGVFTGDGKVFNLIPTSAAAWRDRNLVDLRDLAVDRFELRRKTTIEAVRDPVTRQWRLVKPLAGRANSDRINGLITTLQMTPVTAFITDSPFVDLETFGFQAPEAEVLLGSGERSVAQLQFGRVATNAPGQMFVRRLSHTNVVLVPTPISVLLQAPLAEFRDRRLISSELDVTRIEFQSGTNQALAERKGTNWTVVQPGPHEADPVEVGYLLGGLSALRIRDFPSAGVADYGRYGLNPPAFLVRLSSGTNSPLELQFSAPTSGDTVYARRGDEPGVYNLSWPEVEALPRTVGQLRTVTFSPTQVLQVTIRQAGHERVLDRSADGGWKVTRGEPGNLLAPALDELAYRLGHLATRRWPVFNEAQMTNLPSARELAHEVVFQFSPGAPLQTLRWRILSVNDAAAVALIYLDDDTHPVGREIPIGLYEDFRREFGIP
jgi:Domain of unknown function (DUF4340)